MQFNALVAILAIALSKNKVIIVSLVFFLATTLVRISYAQIGEWDLGDRSPLAPSSGLFLGAIIAALPSYRGRFAWPLFLVSFFLVLLVFTKARFDTFGVVGGAGKIASFLSAPVLRSLGRLSFGIYLWLWPITRFLIVSFDPITTFVVSMSASIVLASLSYILIEQPAREYGKSRRVSDHQYPLIAMFSAHNRLKKGR